MMAYVGHESGTIGIARMTGKEKRKTRIAIATYGPSLQRQLGAY